MMRRVLVILVLLCGWYPAQAGWKAGVAVRTITPTEPMWLAGYASRTKPAEGKEHDLFIKALALEDPTGQRVVLLTGDLITMPRGVSLAVSRAIEKRTGLTRDRLMFAVSHSHCTPVINDNLASMYTMPEAEQKKVAPYTHKLTEWMTEAIVEALGKLEPADLRTGLGQATFAMNRRKPTDKGVMNEANPAGPVDHDVPVLEVRVGGKVRAIVFGYACHNTTMQFYRWCGDYAGFAQQYLQERHSGALALFWTGCGGDQNPLPRSKIELCHKYGQQLADAVDRVLKVPMDEVTGKLVTRYAEIELPFGTVLTKEQIAADQLSKTQAIQQRANRLRKQLEAKGKLNETYPYYPVQVWHLGDRVTWVALGGEVVVDYSRRIKKELGASNLWVTAYANDVVAYIPSARVLKEGGYEADSSQIYYGMPGKWSPAIEDRIISKVRELVEAVRRSRE